MTDAIDFAQVPKQALIDALRNSGLGTPSMRHQRKADLVSQARRALGTDRGPGLRQNIEVETAFRRSGRWEITA